DLAHQRAFSENTQSVIDSEVSKIIKECYDKAEAILKENMDKLEACAQLLLEKERITKEEFEGLFGESKPADAAPAIDSIALD
nr:cell division protein FtsH [Lachnospiraceae bacterium]